MELDYRYKNIFSYENEFSWMLMYSFIGFFLPFVFHNQIILGSLVNCLLFLGAMQLNKHKLLPVILLPSIGSFVFGILFGESTSFILLMIPFIWIGNSLFVIFIKKFKNKILIGSLVSPLIKSLFLFSTAFIMFSFQLIPKIFLIAFGPVQLITAVVGFYLGLLIKSAVKF